jgi:AbrB family looped-hinge helix DNA binding protein
MGIATLSSKGQLTIPSDIRQRLDLKSGDKVEFRLNANGTVTLAAVKPWASMILLVGSRLVRRRAKRRVSVQRAPESLTSRHDRH